MVIETVVWYVLVLVIGIITFPIVSMVCKNLADHGYCISKVVGLLLLTYLTWILSYPLSFNRSAILIAMAATVVASLLCIKNMPRVKKEIIIRNEVLFLAVFMIFLVIRAHSPEITDFGEKYMDFAFLNAVMRSSHFPPHDPWFAGGLLDFYYYFGYLIVATLSKLSGVPSTIAYNLGLVTFSALAASAAFGIGYNLTKKVGYGIWTTIFVVFIANPSIVFKLVESLLQPPIAIHAQMFGCWASTRIIPNTINEFPYFSFIFGDLHPHVISIPFQLLALTLILNTCKCKHRPGNRENAAEMILLALAIGALFLINAWDYPAYLFLFAIAVLIRQYRAARIRNALIPIMIVSILSILLYAPFYMDFQGTGTSGIGIGIVQQQTSLLNFVEIFALFLFLMFSFLFLHSNFDRRYVIALIPLTLLSLLIFQTLLIIVPLILLCVYLFRYGAEEAERTERTEEAEMTENSRFVLILMLTGALLALFCEVFYLDDNLGAPNERMNTVFKLYLQIWVMWGIASGYCVYPIMSVLKRISRAIGTGWNVLFCILLLSCCIFPFTATSELIGFHHNPPTLNGIAYLNGSDGADRGDYLAIVWIRKEIAGTPAIVEAPGNCYSTDSRISAFTGLPNIIGWRGHELMWRGHDGWCEISARTEDVNTIYETQSTQLAIDLLNKYNVSYIHIGSTERARYGRGVDKFEDEDHFECVYLGLNRIYRVKMCS
jgi:YYY domain-containing protein